jgi:hypothetical protein
MLHCGLAADRFIGDCGIERGAFVVEQVSSAQIQFAAGHTLRLRACGPVGAAKFHRFPGAAGGTAANHGKNEIKPPLPNVKR